MQNCAPVSEISLDLCKSLRKGTPAYESLLRKTMPPMVCPFERVSLKKCAREFVNKKIVLFKGTFDLSNAYVDIENTNFLPIGGTSWLIYIRLLEKFKNKKIVVLCMNLKIAFIVSQRRNFTTSRKN